MESDLSMLMVDAQLSRDGTPLTLSGPTVAGTTFTYTIQLDSFEWSDSGNYTCTATLRPRPPLPYLIASGTLLHTVRVTTGKIILNCCRNIEEYLHCILYIIGVYISLRDKVYTNNSNVHITDIGERGNGALLCFTDLTECCKVDRNRSALGEWIYPNGSTVGVNSTGQEFYKNRGPSRVRLHRRENVISPIGHFCCEVPDATLTHVRICVNVGESTQLYDAN